MALRLAVPYWQQPKSQWYKSIPGRRRRDAQLRAQPICEWCQKDGMVTVATVAHHERPFDTWQDFLSIPLISLCVDCHNGEAQRRELGSISVVDANGWPLTSSAPRRRKRF
jgi:5-methylcytosine-specific restriction enzyme A